MQEARPRKKIRKRYLIGVPVAVAAGGATVYAIPQAADPERPKDCGNILPDPTAVMPAKIAGPVAPEPKWTQRGGSVNDASCLDRTAIAGIITPTSEAEVAGALAYARTHGLTISPAGVRHSMGGQAFLKGGIMLDMRAMKGITLDAAAQTVTVGSGASWHTIQNAIHPKFAVKAMQSTDIFSVGGSISVNAHGMDHKAGALMRSIKSLRVMLADGSVITASPTENTDLFNHIVGGYGLFGIILSATLDVVPNDIYASERELIPTKDFPAKFGKIAADPEIGLMYAHLSTAPGNLLDEAIIYNYRKASDQSLERPPLGEVGWVKLRRLTVNLSKRGDMFRSLKWWSEKKLEPKVESCTVTRAQAMKDGEACLVSRNDPMHDSVPYLMNNLPRETDILHEYFVPRDKILPFIEGLRTLFREHDTNLINASVRAVDAESNALSYAPGPAFSVVLYINQPTDAEGTEKMRALTSDLIDLSTKHGGRFFLPYQLHYSAAQLKSAYPEIGSFLSAKKRLDPEGRFSNTWYARYGGELIAPQNSPTPSAPQ